MPAPWEDWQAQQPEQTQAPAPWEDWQAQPAQAAQPEAKSLPEKLMETWPVRMAKGIGNAVYSAATLPGDVYSGQTQVDPSNPEFIGRTLDFATVASPVTPRTATSLAPVIGAPTPEMLGTAADQGYKAVRELGAEYNPQSVATLAQTVAQTLEKDNFRAGRAPATHEALATMAKPPPGAVSTINDLQYAKQVFGDIAKEPTKYTATDRTAANIAKRHIEQYIANPNPADVLAGDAAQAAKSLREADQNYAALKRSEQITGAQDVAEGNAAAANSGRNIDNAYRQRFNAILKSDKQSYGFSPEEIARMEALRNGTPSANAMRYAGNLLSGVGGQTAGFLGAWYNPFLAATPMVGHLLKKGADFSTLRQIKALDEATRMRSALGEQMAAQPAAMSPAEQLRQTALIKALMSGGVGGQQQ